MEQRGRHDRQRRVDRAGRARILGGVDIGHGAIVAAWSTVCQSRQKCQPTRSCPQSPKNSLVGRPLWA